ncbi:MAG: hypothetical protein QG602_216 [Verrucomicrobiota bacterium]|nr:hypothetical protein [Verrucomicrobiota bacterium]
MKAGIIRALVLSFALNAISASADTADKWIAKARAFLGNESALTAVTSIHFTGTMEAPGDLKLPAEIVFQKFFRQRITLKGPKVIEITALDGYDAWQKRINAENPLQWQVVLLDALQVKRLRANTLENLSFYSGHEMKDCAIQVAGDSDVDGVACVKLTFAHVGGVTFQRFFEKATGRLVKTITENGTEIREEGELVVSGVRFPRRVVNKAPNGTVTAITFEKVVVNESFPAEIFTVPALQSR